MNDYRELILALRCCAAAADTIENLLTQNRAQQDIIEKQAALNKQMADCVLEQDKKIGKLQEELRVAESQQLAEANEEVERLHRENFWLSNPKGEEKA